MKRQKIYELEIAAPLTEDKRELVEHYIVANAHLADRPVTFEWDEQETDVLHIKADPALIDIVFEKTKVDIYLSAPSWAKLLLTKAKKAQVRELVETALREVISTEPGVVGSAEAAVSIDANLDQRDHGNETYTALPDTLSQTKHESEVTAADPTNSLAIPLKQAANATPEYHNAFNGRESLSSYDPLIKLFSKTEAAATQPLGSVSASLDEAAPEVDALSEPEISARTAKTVNKVQQRIGSGAYYTGYGLSYGIVFSAVFLTELLPEGNVIRRGFEDGAAAGMSAAHRRQV